MVCYFPTIEEKGRSIARELDDEDNGGVEVKLKVSKKRFVAFLCILIVFSVIIGQASADIPCLCGNPPDQCTCFIQMGDKGPAVKGIIVILKREGYLDHKHKKDGFSEEVRQAVIQFQAKNHLECTGYMDDETLDVLLYDELPDSERKFEAERWLDVVYIPTDGGIRYHTNPTCCEMHHPRMISRVNAEKLGIQHCGLMESCPYASDRHIVYSLLDIDSRILPDEYYIEEDLTAEVSPDGAVLRSIFPSDSNGQIYIGNKSKHVFHLESCSSVNRMSEKNKVMFATREEAIAEDYRPCEKCKP